MFPTVMHKYVGIAVSPGVAFGEALIIDNERFHVPRRTLPPDAAPRELARFQAAVEKIGEGIADRRDKVSRDVGPQYGAIFSAHLQMVRDPQFHRGVEDLIRQERRSAGYAVSRTLQRYAQIFQNSGSRYMAERAHDILDIERLLLGELLGQRQEDLSRLTRPIIVLAHILTPSETIKLHHDFVLAFVTESGGAGGHVAIVAEALEIPAVVATGAFLADVSDGDEVIVDGDAGHVIIRPDQETARRYRREAKLLDERQRQLRQLHDQPATTLDGVRIKVRANIEFPYEVQTCLDRGADGIGLYRTEFLYLEGNSQPSEDDQYQAYREVLCSMYPRSVAIRTLDLGADKIDSATDCESERNPFLGLRSIRLSLRESTLFCTQLRAILRASAHGDCRLMFPLISTLDELRTAKALLHDVMDELDGQGVAFQKDMPVGIMVEVPAVITMLDRFLAEVDFISIGTNDLIQYALAVDRSNPDVAELYNASDPSIVRLINTALKQAEQAGIPASVCGQMSAQPKYLMLLLGLGLRDLSVPPHAVPEIRQLCRSVTIEQCRSVAQQALMLDTATEISQMLTTELAVATGGHASPS